MTTNFGNNPGLSGSIPVVQTTAGPEYATSINTILNALLDRWQTSIKTADISIDAAFEMNNNRITELSGSSFIDHASSGPSAVSFPRMVYFVDGELHTNDGAGNSIQITDGGSLNSALVGGIGGDYTSTDADVSWVAASGSYFFTSAANTAAQIDVGEVRIKRSTGDKGVRFRAPAGLAADYNIQLPDAVPTKDELIIMDSTGSLRASTDSVLTCSSMQITSGTLIHGTRKLWLHAGFFQGVNGAFASPESDNGPEMTTHQYMDVDSGGNSTIMSFPLHEGDRILQYDLIYYTTTAASWTMYTNQIDVTGSDNTANTHGWTTGTGGYQTESVTGSFLPMTLLEDQMYYVRIANGAAARLVGVRVHYDRLTK